MPFDNLLSLPFYSLPKKRQIGLLLRPISNHPHSFKVDADSDMANSMNINGSSANSIRSVARSTTSLSSAASTSTVSPSLHANSTRMSPARRIATNVRAGRPIEMKDRCGSAESTSRLLTLSVATLPNQITLSLYYHLPPTLSCPSLRFPSDRLHRQPP